MEFLSIRRGSLISKIVFPVFFTITLIGGGLYYFSLKALSDFVEERIQHEIQSFANEIYNICDKSITDLIFEGKSSDEKSILFKKALTLDSIKNYAKEKDIAIVVFSDNKELLVTDKIDINLLMKELINQGSISTLKLNNESYYASLVNFQPWNWQIFILANPSKYISLQNKVRNSYFASAIILLIGFLSLIGWLHIIIRRPIDSIIESLKTGAVPAYRGTKEIEFLSKAIKTIIDSLQRKIKKLEETENELMSAKEFNETVMNSLCDALCIIEVGSCKIIKANKTFEEIFESQKGLIAGKKCHEVIFSNEDLCLKCLFDEVIEKSKTKTFEHIINNNSSKRYLEVSISPLKDFNGNVTHIVFLAKDVTDRKYLEEKLRQSQRLESIGILAGGIAHDFNNILTAIVGYANLLQMKVANDPTLNRYVEQILKSSDRAENLVSSLLAFSKKQIIHPVALDLNEEIKKVGKFLRRLIEESIQIDIKLSEEKIMVMADPSQLDLVIINLAINARDAMPNGGLLCIETGFVVIDDDYFHREGDFLRGGRYATIKVIDTGIGIDPDMIGKIFDPFFTTKEIGKGIGLGLSTVYGIIKQHDGSIEVHSEKGKGTTFIIYLPLISTLIEELKDTLRIKSRSQLHGEETILIAEDEDLVRESYSEVLQNFGYKVLSAKDGEEALAAFNKHKDGIDLVLTDVIMPRKNGKELIKEIQSVKPDIKVIFMSGYSQDLIDDKSLIEDKTYFLPKPITPINLLKIIKEILHPLDKNT